MSGKDILWQMVKKLFFIFLLLFIASGCVHLGAPTEIPSLPIAKIEAINPQDRILILAPHPDDEVIGCAGIIQEAVEAGAAVYVAYLTNGDHNQFAFIVYEKRLTFRKGEFIHMGEVRRSESIKAMKFLGVDEGNLFFLGYPDFGTFAIFSQRWQNQKPYRSMLTRISSVPYKENLSFGAPYKGESVLRDLKKVLLVSRPNKIFVSHPADVNVDHKSFYLFLQAALSDLKIYHPKVYPYLIHCVGWPSPRHYHPELSLIPPKKFLDSQISWQELELTPQQLERKRQAILCHRSQTRSSAFYLLAFARKNELFGDYSDITLALASAEAPMDKGRQALEEAGLFFGFSNMFSDLRDDELTAEAGNIAEDSKGQVSYGLGGNRLLVRIERKEKLGRGFSVLFYLFGYSDKTPFAQMPKLRIITKGRKFFIFDGRKKIRCVTGVELKLNKKDMILKVPLKLLGNPDFVLASLKSYSGSIPADTVSFRRINIKS